MKLKNLTQRDICQEHVIDILEHYGYAGTFIAGTGFGKSRVIVKLLLRMIKTIALKKVLILVPFEHLKDRFRDEFCAILGEKKGKLFVEKFIQLECYASIKKLNPLDYNRIICDEIHLGLTPKCEEFYMKARNGGVRMVFCTATTPEDARQRMIMTNMAPIRFVITLDECVELGFVSSYTIECVGIELNQEEKELYATVSKNFAHWKMKLVEEAEKAEEERLKSLKLIDSKQFHNLVGVPIFVDAFSEANRIVKSRGSKKFTPVQYKAASGFFRAIRQRKGLVDHAENKIQIAKEYGKITKEDNGRMLVFGGDNEFTDRIAQELPGAVIYHSSLAAKARKLALQLFKSRKAWVLCSTKALNQGLDVPDADTGLICGLTSKMNTMVQRVGRLVRVDPNNPDKCGVIKIVYVKNSQEQKWLENALKSISSKRIKWTDGQEFLKSLTENTSRMA